MFEKNFNFENKNKKTASDEIRKLLNNTGAKISAREYDYLDLWKKKILQLSGNN